MKKRDLVFFVLILAMLPFYFVLATSYNQAPSTAGNGTTVRMLSFNITNISTVGNGNTLNTITINLTGTASAGNLTNATLYNGVTVLGYNDSFSSNLFNVTIGSNVTSQINVTINLTINSAPTDNSTLKINVTNIYAGVNVSYDSLFYVSGLTTIDSANPYLEYGTGTTSSANLSQGYINVNISANDTVSNLGTIIIYLYNATSQVNSSANSSLSATRAIHTFNFTNLIDGTYYINATVNDSYSHVNSTSTRTITLDTVAPTVTLPAYTNATIKQNTQSLTLNISITDATSGLGGSLCLVDVNGTNQTLTPSGGWCNSSSIALTGLSDGNKTIKVYVNDSANNLALNNSYVVLVDTTSPSASPSCTPSLAHTGDTVTCTCSGSDSTSGVATTSATSTPSTANTGTFSYGCTVTDNAGNSASASTSYNVELLGSGGGSSGGGGGGSSTTTFWTAGTYAISDAQFKEGHSMEILAKQRVKLKIANQDHYVGVKTLAVGSALISVSSDPQEKTVLVGDEWKVDVTGDKYYDLSVKLTSISNNKATVAIKSIYEAIPQTPPPTPAPAANSGEPVITGKATTGETQGKSLSWLWIVLGIIIVALIVWLIMHNKNRH
ncbi:hypothetical protein HY212_03375 [Candidatus Pacearchaeota archaeon]|nr:hypothetical protein [Candidatus Pacearchaeota archaeon]